MSQLVVSNIEKIILENGVTVFLDPAPQFRSASVIITAIGGSRLESEKISGVSHLLEHLLFKRTGLLTPKEIAYQIDDFGGEVNAFTDSESLCLYGTVIRDRVEELFDFLSDLLLNPVLTEEDMTIEKSIVRQEILEALDDTSDLVSQEFRKIVWGNDSLALPIFGTLESVEALTLDDIRAELTRLLKGRRVIVALSGIGENRERVLEKVKKTFSKLPPGERPVFSTKVVKPSTKVLARPGKQTHLTLGWEWPDLRSDSYLSGMCMVSLLGHGVSSRLFQVLREEEGLCYDLGLSVDAYPDTGYCAFTSLFEAKNFTQISELLKRELDGICSGGVTQEEFHRTKRLIRAQLEMEEDSLRGKLWRAVESEIAHERIISTDELLQKLEAVTKEEIEKIARDYLTRPRYAVVGGKIPKKVEETLRW